MKNIELLAPAGSLESLKAAVNSGANAVYLGGTMFNARAYATNFSDEELQVAIEYAHLRNVKIYVTVNTLFYDEEFKELMTYIDRLYLMNVDALIIQDLGLMAEVKKLYPDFEIHASTQASIHQLSGVEAMAKQGVERVVLARENTIEEIRDIAQHTQIDIEVFVHGALCMCYSGQCLMSSLIGKRSGNRGKCAQPCRLPYKLKLEDKSLDYAPHYLLSAKDICVIENIGDYIEAGVTSFKIEGRMKRPEYVAAVVKSYRHAIDQWLKTHSVGDVQENKAEMFQMFNRGFSLGHAYHENNLITDIFPGNFGVEIGEVTQYDRDEQLVYIKLNQPLAQGDGIRFGFEDSGRVVNKMYYRDRLVNQGKSQDEVAVEFNVKIKEGTKVFKTSSVQLIQKLQKEYSEKKIKSPITLQLSGKIGEPLALTLTSKQHRVTVQSSAIVEKAMNSALSLERIQQQLSKLGNTVYTAEKVIVNLPDGVQFAIKALNELRRNGIEALDKARLTHQRQSKVFKPKETAVSERSIKAIHVHVQTLEQCKAAIDSGAKIIYYPFVTSLKEAHFLCQQAGVTLIPYVARIIDDEHLKQIKESSLYSLFNKIMVGDIGALHYFLEKEVILDSSLNITNSYALNHDLIKNIAVVLSVEMSEMQVNHLCDCQQKIGYVAYGRLETMFTKYCPISQQHYGCQKKGCNRCKIGQYYLIDRKNEQFPIIMDEECRMHLYNAKIQYVDELSELQVDFIVLKMTIETQAEVQRVIEDYQHIIADKSQSYWHGNKDYTLGYFNNKEVK